MKTLPRSQDVYRPGRIYKEWTRLAPEYGELLYVCRQDYSEASGTLSNYPLTGDSGRGCTCRIPLRMIVLRAVM